MTFIDFNAAATTSLLPSFAGRTIWLTPHLNRQLHSQAKQGHIMILPLLATFGGSALHAGWVMGERHCGLHFVAMLPAGATSPAVLYVTILQELIRINRRRMRAGMELLVIHGL